MQSISSNYSTTSVPAAGRGLAAATVLLCALFIGLTWTATRSLVDEERRQALDNAVAESRGIASIIVANTSELLDRSLMYARMSRPLLGPGKGASFVHPRMLGDTAYQRHAVFRRDGMTAHSSTAGDDPILQGLVKRLLSRSPAAGTGETVVIGIPADPEAGGFWGIPVAARVESESGQAAGAFAAYIDFGYLLDLYKEVSPRPGITIELTDIDGSSIAELRDGMVMARQTGSRGTQPIRSLRGEDFFVFRDGYAGAGPVGVLRRLERFPVAVSVRHDAAILLAAFERRHRGYYLRAAFASLGLVLLGCWLVRLARRQEILYEDLSRSEQQNRMLIEQLEAEKARAVELASHDFLTGLPNRMMFHQLAATELARARRRPKMSALYFLDLDKFKAINDTLGHGVGDLLLKAVADRLRANLREYDLIARLGGDEFVVLVSELESTRRAAAIAQKLVDALSAPYKDLAGRQVETSPSIGIALYPGDGTDIDSLLAAADLAMYDAKRSGRGTYRFHDSTLNTAATRRLELVSDLRPAMRENQFRLHYQMRISLEDYAPVALEALLRWEHPKHGTISPAEFISLAEEYDVIDTLGRWVIDAACAQLSLWRGEGLPLLPLAINISARQLRDTSLVDVFSASLARHEIHPGLVEIEVTESCFIERPEIAREVLNGLHRLGITIALDDYGTGFSGLSHLKQLPIRTIKIDRSFIHDIRNDASDAMIVASTISLAHSLGLRVVAEGVETRDQLVHLKAAGCDEVQGFYFHRPGDGASVGASLRERLLQPERET